MEFFFTLMRTYGHKYAMETFCTESALAANNSMRKESMSVEWCALFSLSISLSLRFGNRNAFFFYS